MADADDYIPVEEAAVILGISPRQARRYQEKVRSKVFGKRIFLHRSDVTALARIKGIEEQADSDAKQYYDRLPPRTDVLPPGELLTYLREREANADKLHQQLLQAAHRIGELENELKQRLLPQDVEALQHQLAQAHEEQATLREERTPLQEQYDQLQHQHQQLQQQLTELQQPWWKRLFRS